MGALRLINRATDYYKEILTEALRNPRPRSPFDLGERSLSYSPV